MTSLFSMAIIVAHLLVITGSFLQAEEAETNRARELEEHVAEQRGITSRIKEVVQKNLSHTINQDTLIVEWSKIKCMVPNVESHHDINMHGVCIVPVTGWEILSQVALVLQQDGSLNIHVLVTNGWF